MEPKTESILSKVGSATLKVRPHFDRWQQSGHS